jgi:recombination protein RecA
LKQTRPNFPGIKIVSPKTNIFLEEYFMSAKDSMKLLKDAVNLIEKQFGKGSVMTLGETPVNAQIEAISTGSIGVDLALGVGGFPKGRIIEIYGPESSGKTTLALQTIAQVHKLGGLCAFIDAEHALDMTYAQALGVQTDKLVIAQPDCGEQALEICEMLVRSGGVELLVLDSVAALVPRAEIEGEMGDAHMGLQARLMSQAMRKLTAIAHKTGCTLLFLNQLRQKIGVVFGNPEVTTGGNALKFYASVRVDIRRTGPIKDGQDIIGNRTKIKIVKNKVAPPFKEIEVDVLYGKGICPTSDLVDRGLDFGILQRSGAWISWNGNQLANGREKALKLFAEDPALATQLRDEVLSVARQGGMAHPERAATEETAINGLELS